MFRGGLLFSEGSWRRGGSGEKGRWGKRWAGEGLQLGCNIREKNKLNIHK